jgi:hypothetical protein
MSDLIKEDSGIRRQMKLIAIEKEIRATSERERERETGQKVSGQDLACDRRRKSEMTPEEEQISNELTEKRD